MEDVVARLDGAGRPADVLWVESPTNPVLEVADLPALVAAANATGSVVVVHHTFATPLGQQPLRLGADAVVHSVAKHLAGHSDVVLGVAVTVSEDLLRLSVGVGDVEDLRADLDQALRRAASEARA